VLRCKPGADEFAAGMNDVLSLYDTIRANGDAYLQLFTYSRTKLTRASFKALCVVEKSEDGSNNAAHEADTLYAWEVFLLNVEG